MAALQALWSYDAGVNVGLQLEDNLRALRLVIQKCQLDLGMHSICKLSIIKGLCTAHTGQLLSGMCSAKGSHIGKRAWWADTIRFWLCEQDGEN